MKPNTIENESVFKKHESYTPEEVFAAGGTTAFGLKLKKERGDTSEALKNSLPAEPFTTEEWDSLMEQLARDK